MAAICTTLVLGATNASASVMQNWEFADLCATDPGQWNQCANVDVYVPDGYRAIVKVTSTASFYSKYFDQPVLLCIGIQTPNDTSAYCEDTSEAGTYLAVSDLRNVATTTLQYLYDAGSYTITSLVNPYEVNLDIEPISDVGKVRTLVDVTLEPVYTILPYDLSTQSVEDPVVSNGSSNLTGPLAIEGRK